MLVRSVETAVDRIRPNPYCLGPSPCLSQCPRRKRRRGIAAGPYLHVDESKVTSPKDIATFDAMLGDLGVNRLFNDGAPYFPRQF
jgi:hypothetical protein